MSYTKTTLLNIVMTIKGIDTSIDRWRIGIMLVTLETASSLCNWSWLPIHNLKDLHAIFYTWESNPNKTVSIYLISTDEILWFENK